MRIGRVELSYADVGFWDRVAVLERREWVLWSEIEGVESLDLRSEESAIEAAASAYI